LPPLNTKNSQKTLFNPIKEETGVAFNTTTDLGLKPEILEGIKPVLRKQTLHNSKNIFMNFKSIEIQIIEEKINAITSE
jgi:hypothetical protein